MLTIRNGRAGVGGPEQGVIAMPMTDEEPEVRTLIVVGVVLACFANEFVSLWSAFG